jgi:signal transduction histidine kinase
VRGLRALTPSVVLADLEETLAEARGGIDRVAKIVRGLKTFSRLDEERTSVVDLVSVFDLAVTMAFNEVHPRARLVREYGPVPAIVADDTRLTQVFINLLVNAAHSFPEGSNDANEIRVVTRTDAGGCAVAEVYDTGAGIPAALLDQVFEPFFTTKPAGVGTGLGLAISQAIVTAIGGKIAVESEPGRGTVVRVTFPPAVVGKASPGRCSSSMTSRRSATPSAVSYGVT